MGFCSLDRVDYHKLSRCSAGEGSNGVREEIDQNGGRPYGHERKKGCRVSAATPDLIGAPSPTRTGGLRIRSPTLYPSELWAQIISDCRLQISDLKIFPLPDPLPQGVREKFVTDLPVVALAANYALTGLRRLNRMAEREGFEPSIPLNTGYSLSRRAPSASRASLHIRPVPVRSGNAPYIIILIPLTAQYRLLEPLSKIAG